MVPTLIYCLVESRINGCAMTFMYLSISTEVITCMHVCVCIYINCPLILKIQQQKCGKGKNV